MFYTKYRPQKFSEITRPNEAADMLATQVKTGKTVHAYLLVGPRGTGKTTTARVLAKALNCTNVTKDGDPCDECENCIAIQNGSFVDLIEIDAASNRGIDDIRELKSRVKLAPTAGKTKVYIIDEVHMLTSEAFNALLKTLEEPPANVVFILCTTEFHKVPDTIKSRCQVFRIKRATITQIVEKLKKIVKSEKLKISDEDLAKIASASVGGFRDAETLLQQIAEGGVSADTFLSSSSKESLIEFTDNLLSKDAKSALHLLDAIFEEGVDLTVWSSELLKYLRELMFIKSGVELDVVGATPELSKKITEQAKLVDVRWLLSALTKLIDAQKNIKGSFIPQLPLEMFVVELCTGDRVETKSAPTNPLPNKPKEVKKPVSDDKADSDDDELASDQSIPLAAKKVLKVISKQEELDDDDEADSVAEEPATGVSNEAEENIIPLEQIEEKWKELVGKSKELNNSIAALLKQAKLKAVEGKSLVMEVFFPFHKERLEAPNNRKLIESLLKEMFGLDIKIKCVLNEERPKNLRKGETGNLTDYNIAPASVNLDKDSLMLAFDGGLPL